MYIRCIARGWSETERHYSVLLSQREYSALIATWLDKAIICCRTVQRQWRNLCHEGWKNATFFVKGIVSRDEYFLKFEIVLFESALMVFTIFSCLFCAGNRKRCFCLLLWNHLLIMKFLPVTFFRESKGKPKQKFDAAYGTIFRISQVFSKKKSKTSYWVYSWTRR